MDSGVLVGKAYSPLKRVPSWNRLSSDFKQEATPVRSFATLRITNIRYGPETIGVGHDPVLKTRLFFLRERTCSV